MSRLGAWLVMIIASVSYYFAIKPLLGLLPSKDPLDWLDMVVFGGMALWVHWLGRERHDQGRSDA